VSKDEDVNKWEQISHGSESNIVGEAVVVVGIEELSNQLLFKVITKLKPKAAPCHMNLPH